jgi:hypothetical protein
VGGLAALVDPLGIAGYLGSSDVFGEIEAGRLAADTTH